MLDQLCDLELVSNVGHLSADFHVLDTVTPGIKLFSFGSGVISSRWLFPALAKCGSE